MANVGLDDIAEVRSSKGKNEVRESKLSSNTFCLAASDPMPLPWLQKSNTRFAFHLGVLDHQPPADNVFVEISEAPDYAYELL